MFRAAPHHNSAPAHRVSCSCISVHATHTHIETSALIHAMRTLRRDGRYKVKRSTSSGEVAAKTSCALDPQWNRPCREGGTACRWPSAGHRLQLQSPEFYTSAQARSFRHRCPHDSCAGGCKMQLRGTRESNRARDFERCLLAFEW